MGGGGRVPSTTSCLPILCSVIGWMGSEAQMEGGAAGVRWWIRATKNSTAGERKEYLRALASPIEKSSASWQKVGEHPQRCRSDLPHRHCAT